MESEFISKEGRYICMHLFMYCMSAYFTTTSFTELIGESNVHHTVQIQVLMLLIMVNKIMVTAITNDLPMNQQR